jgi:hypothetical protein
MKLFGRRWRITVGTLQSSEIDVRFKVTRTLTTAPGTAEVELFNLTTDHRREIHQARLPLVRIEAGYRDAMPMLFQGDGRRVDVTRDGADWVTKVTAGDGEHAIRTARVSRSFGPDTQLQGVVQAIADAMGVGSGNVVEQLRGRGLDRLGDTFPEGLVLSGLAAVQLSAMLRSAGLTWSVQDGVLQVIPRGGALTRTAVRLTPDTGLIESPEVGKSRVVTARALLIPDLVPGQLVQLESRVVAGLYRIEKAEYAADTRGDDWTASLELREAQ